MSEKDYEALGRYAEATERFEQAHKARDGKAREMERLLHPLTHIAGATYGLPATLLHIAKEASELDAQMREWAAKANLEAHKLGKATIDIKEIHP